MDEWTNAMDTNVALMEVARRINGFLAPAGGYVGGEITVTSGWHTPSMRLTVGFPEDRLKEYTVRGAPPDRLGAGMPTEAFFEAVKRASVEYAEVPPMAEYEIRWASKEPESGEEKQVLDKVIKGSGPMLIASLTD